MHFYILSYALLCIFHHINVSWNKQKTKSMWKMSGIISFFWYQKLTKIDKNSQNFMKIWLKTVLFRNIALICSLEKQCYLENRVVREPCKRRTACSRYMIVSHAHVATLGLCYLIRYDLLATPYYDTRCLVLISGIQNPKVIQC